MSDVFWEPYIPAVGDLVRIRISDECPQSGKQHGTRGGSLGLNGEVAWINKYAPNGHRFIVEVLTDGKRYFPHYAANELEPVMEETTP